MRRVLDLDGDVFAMPPHPNKDVPLYFSRGHLPLVGDVIANTYTDYWVHPDTPYGRAELWADPPFLRVAAVEPIVDTESVPVGVGVDHVEIVGYEGTPIVIRYAWCEGDQAWSCDSRPHFDLPGAVPGGWAIRVESAMYPEHPARPGDPLWCGPHGPPPTGRPLNEVAA